MATRTKKTTAKDTAANDDFDQGGADGASAQRGHNSGKFDGAMLAQACEDIAEHELRMKKRLEEAKKKNQADREKIKDIKKDVVESGTPAKEFNTLLRKKRMETALANIDATLDDDQKETFAAILEAIGPFEDTPLGKAALAKAKR